MTAEQLLTRLSGARRNGGGWIARCPAHDDKNPSLSVHDVEGTILLHCFAGCSFDEIVSAIKLNPQGLFTHTGDKQIVACYDYLVAHFLTKKSAASPLCSSRSLSRDLETFGKGWPKSKVSRSDMPMPFMVRVTCLFVSIPNSLSTLPNLVNQIT